MIIGLVGFAGSGKGTVGDILVNDHDFTKLSFADAVKDATSAIFGWPRNLLEGDTDESRKFRETKDDFWSARLDRDFTPRLAMQLMGTEAGRNVFHTNLWVDVVERRIKYKQEWEFEDNFVIPDVRFVNEIEAIRKWGGVIVRIARGSDPEWYDLAHAANSETFLHAPEAYDEMVKLGIHISEWAWIGQQFNYQISNNGTLAMLEADVNHMMKVFTGPIKSDTMNK
jgi:hypothetical protein